LFSWNEGAEIPIIPVVHGTDSRSAAKIAKTGLMATCTTDNGHFGKGIYFTSSAKYALPYYAQREYPALLICYILPGNTYPVSENHFELRGLPMKSFYNSSYVLTNRNGSCCNEIKENDFYDEIVIEQENQIAPVYILEFGLKELKEQWDEFKKSIPEEDFYIRTEPYSNNQLIDY